MTRVEMMTCSCEFIQSSLIVHYIPYSMLCFVEMTSFPRAIAAKAKDADIGNACIISLAVLNANLSSQKLLLDEQLQVTITSVCNSHE